MLFRHSLPPSDKSFHCLGDWEGPDGQRYVALMDTQATSRYGGQGGNGDGSERPRYRCALYEEDVESGHIRMALSSDSTCINQLRSPTDGYETLRLRPKFPPAWPSHLRYPAVAGKSLINLSHHESFLYVLYKI